jgi:uncharacterized membrane protein
MSPRRRPRRGRLRLTLLTGTLALIPLTITYIALSYLFNLMDDLLKPLVVRLAILAGMKPGPEDTFPGLGVAATLLVILLTGFMARNYLGRTMGTWAERLIHKIPLVSGIYFGSKQLVEAVTLRNQKSFREVVLVAYPRPGVYAVGFITNDVQRRYGKGLGRLCSIFVPTTPNPTSGMLVLVPEEEIIRTSITVEDGIRMVVSGGILLPEDGGGCPEPDPPGGGTAEG